MIHMTDSHTFHPSPRYIVLAAVSFILAALLGWNLRSEPAWSSFFFAAVGLLGGAWALWMASSRVQVDEHGVTLRRWFTAEHQVSFQQMVTAGEVGHLTRVIVITYYPRQVNGLLDLDAIATLALPTVSNQAALVTLLEEKAPA